MSQSHLYLRRPAVTAPRPDAEAVLPFWLAVPIIGGLSLALWVLLWIFGCWGVGVVRAWLAGT